MSSMKTRLLHALAALHRAGQRVGVNITPHHFYSDIPDYNHLQKEDYWRKPRDFSSINGADLESQLTFVRDIATPFRERMLKGDIHSSACEKNGERGYGPIEADFLHCYIAHHKPPRIVQVGCGVSTALVLQAAEEAGYTPEVVCIEPFPTQLLNDENDASRITLIPEMAQRVDIQHLTNLEPGDLLFIDSTHTVKPGSEVLRLILDVLPHLKPGVHVHFHDIYFPYDYSPSLLPSMTFPWRETPFLQAFLTMNPGYRIQASLSMLHHAEIPEMRELLPNYNPMKAEKGLRVSRGHFPSSIFLKRIDSRENAQ